MGSKTKTNWYNRMGSQEKPTVEKQAADEGQKVEKRSKKISKEPASQAVTPTSESVEVKTTIKITFEGEAAQKIFKCESELRERLSKPDMGKVLGSEILAWTDKRWSEIVEENTDIDYFFAQIRKCTDKSKSIKLLKALSEKLKSENPDTSVVSGSVSPGLSGSSSEEVRSDVG